VVAGCGCVIIITIGVVARSDKGPVGWSLGWPSVGVVVRAGRLLLVYDWWFVTVRVDGCGEGVGRHGWFRFLTVCVDVCGEGSCRGLSVLGATVRVDGCGGGWFGADVI